MERFKLSLTRSDFDFLRSLQRRRLWDWPAVFSTNPRGDIWPFATSGYTPAKDREEVRGLSPVIDQVADLLVKVRSDGGRFFIDDFGAFYKDDKIGADLNLFVLFEIKETPKFPA
jgi:hypothetical protein